MDFNFTKDPWVMRYLVSLGVLTGLIVVAYVFPLSKPKAKEKEESEKDRILR